MISFWYAIKYFICSESNIEPSYIPKQDIIAPVIHSLRELWASILLSLHSNEKHKEDVEKMYKNVTLQ